MRYTLFPVTNRTHSVLLDSSVPECTQANWLLLRRSDEPLFPKLAKRRTWRMVKQDLERVGIPYVTNAGIADFHAAGRHTYITQLLRHGASLPEAKELARHTDVKMTMKYTHIGLADQARALAALPTPNAEPASSQIASFGSVVAPGHRANGARGQIGSPPVTVAGKSSSPLRNLFRPQTTTHFCDCTPASFGAHQFPLAASLKISMSKAWFATTFFKRTFSC